MTLRSHLLHSFGHHPPNLTQPSILLVIELHLIIHIFDIIHIFFLGGGGENW